MSVTFEKCDLKVDENIVVILKLHHKEVAETGATIGAYYAVQEQNESGESPTPAIKVHGYPCLAKIKINSYPERVQGKPDATIFIDKGGWEKMAPGEKDALIDHELQHLQSVREKDKPLIWKRDNIGHPILKIRKHDHQFGWFNVIAERHGDNSVEIKQAKMFANQHGQLYFGWAAPPGGGSEQLTLDSGKAVDTKSGWFKGGAAGKKREGPHLYTPSELEIPPGDLAAACQVSILSMAQQGKHTDIHRTVTLGTIRYVVTPAPAGQPDDVYALRQLHGEETGEATESDPYLGARVTIDGEVLHIGPVGEMLLAKDEEPDLSTEAIDEDKAAKSKRGRRAKVA